MKKYLFLFVFIASFVGMQAQDNDPVIMKINGKEIKKSEFEYIYNKNNTENAIDKKSLDEYVEMFKNFKLRVAEAEAQGLDKTEAFDKEFNEYRSLLAKPYLSEVKIDESLLQKEYAGHLFYSETNHIFLPFGEDGSAPVAEVFPADTLELYKKALMVRKKFLDGEAFEDLAKTYTADKKSARSERPGYMGWISGMQLLPALGLPINEVPVGEISQPIRTNFGYHLFHVIARKPNTDPVSINAAHILIQVPANAEEAAVADAKAQIDKLYDQLKNGADFAVLAKDHSQDGSAVNGGDLGWFGKGRMVKEFEDAAFALKKDGDISEPVRSQFGFHIIKLLGQKPYPSLDEVREDVITKLKRTGFELDLLTPAIEQMKKEFGFALNEKVFNTLYKTAETLYPTDSLFFDMYANNKDILFVIDDVSSSVSDFIQYMEKNPRAHTVLSTDVLKEKLASFEYQQLTNAKDRSLEKQYPEFRNLVQEYRDGILLFEVSNKEVWERSSSDTEGLEKFFEANRAKYTWNEPRYKGYIVYVKDAKSSKKMQKEINKMQADEAAQYLLDNYKVGDVSYIKLEKALFAKGENAFVDEQVFKTGKATLPEEYESFFVIGKLLPDGVESYTDARGQVITDYQDYLEKNWLKELNSKYEVVIYEEVLKTVK